MKKYLRTIMAGGFVVLLAGAGCTANVDTEADIDADATNGRRSTTYDEATGLEVTIDGEGVADVDVTTDDGASASADAEAATSAAAELEALGADATGALGGVSEGESSF